ncbi:uncharacterized protein LOC125668794 isoform X4 [Ostrea edulis]|uniref:uncharacterized protein LOC125668794 isoform X4 n=1 Tax=Ostrea edulis TaxID=37623 RepID=UPI0024AFEC82|nr:uncharacterized protein LOC125668794 isoform X4 [Ostrea edulis]XP_056019577.1 uncharacterized protein LOC125668794 isoform X4 [Ostrea edulis]XP_056019578.1 uncharacterized protein LOC125668794 isoform X4 [Ostrea edulis]
MNTDELIAIVGGSLAGLVVILIVLAVLIYCVCGKRKKHEEKHRRLPQSGSHDTSLGKNSKYGNGMDPRMEHSDPRLPKVGTNGLWMGAPSIYTPGKSQMYYNDNQRKQQPAMQRAISDDRLSPPYLVYQGNSQIYHSQQAPSSYEQYGRLPNSNNYLELYPPSPYAGYPSGGYGGVRDSRTLLVEYPDDQGAIYDPYRDVFEDRKRGKKVQRTHSDLTGTKRRKRERKYDSPYDLENRSSNRGKKETSDRHQKGSLEGRVPRTASVEIHERQSRDHKQREMRQNMNGVRDDKETKPEVNEQELSQTDSAKLRAMQEKSKDFVDSKPVSTQWNNKEELRLNLPKDSDDEEVEVKRYEYSGHIKRERAHSSEKQENIRNNLKESTFVSVTVRPDVYEKNGHDNPVFSGEDPVSSRASTRGRADSNTDGKQVSAAFDFLNNYLSDDEGTDYLGSRPHSPVPL